MSIDKRANFTDERMKWRGPVSTRIASLEWALAHGHEDYECAMSGDDRPRPVPPPPPTLIERIRLFRAGRLDASLDSLLTDIVEELETLEEERDSW